MDKQKHIALITTWFPPKQGVATNRMIAFADYLSEKYQVTVFTQSNQESTRVIHSQLSVHTLRSSSVLDRIASDKKDSKWKHTFKTAMRVLLGYFVKNPNSSWKKSVVEAVKQVHSQTPFDLVISSYAPVEAHLAAIQLKKELPSLVWIADMRDEMSKNPGYSDRTKKYMSSVEQKINRYADAITSVSKPIIDDFRMLCRNVVHFEEIRNGYNHRLIFPQPEDKRTTIKFGYFGSFYGIIKPDQLFKTFVNSQNLLNFEFHVYGAHANFSIPAAIKDSVFIHEGLPYLEAIKKMNEMDVNVVIYPTNGRKGVYTGKLFDYISARKPVLALMDESDVAAQLLQSLNAGYVCDNGNLEKMRKCILEIQKELSEGTWRIANDEQVRSLHREEEINKLDHLIQHLL